MNTYKKKLLLIYLQNISIKIAIKMNLYLSSFQPQEVFYTFFFFISIFILQLKQQVTPERHEKSCHNINLFNFKTEIKALHSDSTRERGESIQLESHTRYHSKHNRCVSINPKFRDCTLEEELTVKLITKTEHRSHSCAALESGYTDVISQILPDHCSV